jgi:endonuclease/exonuclease/phosphatase family metal-dependent hydrolase
MSYNIRVAVDEGTNSWGNRKEKVASMIRFHHADIVGLQEALKIQVEDLITLLPEYDWSGVGRDDGRDKGEFSAILFRKEKFELLKGYTFWLSETPDTVSVGWDAALPRIASWVKLKDKETGKTFLHLNTHFDHVGAEARNNSAKLIIKKISEMQNIVELPIIITGDLNCNPESDPYRIFTASFVDTRTNSIHPFYGSDITFNGFGNSIIPGNRIDYIFVNNLILTYQTGIIGEIFDGNYPSDHMPVIAEIIFK